MNYNECMTGNTCENYKWMEIFIAVIWWKSKKKHVLMYVVALYYYVSIHSSNPFFQIALKTELEYMG